MKRLTGHLGKVIVVAIVIGGIRYGQDLEDWSKLLGYQPPTEIARLATVTTMTDTARQLFYVNQPTIETQKSSLNLCKGSEQTIVLGCYVPTEGIFLQAVVDPRLQGVMEVTAAHEMLHAAYQRLSLTEQADLNQQLRSALGQLKNPRILKLVKTYEDRNPKSVNSELHSIFGTEVRDLDPELEQYYRRYFTDRSAIVALSERYEGVFTALQSKAKLLSQELVRRKSVRSQLVTQVKQEANSIESTRSDLKTAIVANPNRDYSFQVAAFNSKVRSYNQLVSQLKAQTDSYNQLVKQRNSITLEEKSLVESLENKSKQQVIQSDSTGRNSTDRSAAH
jgi:hypothetical protein